MHKSLITGAPAGLEGTLPGFTGTTDDEVRGTSTGIQWLRYKAYGTLAEKSHSETMKSVMMGLYYVCPNVEALNIKGQAASGTAVAMSYQAAVTAYGLLYAALLLTTACLVFQRRDF
jgi:hypothetical protein